MALYLIAVVAQVAVLGAASQVGAVFLGTGLGLGSLSEKNQDVFINKTLPNAELTRELRSK